jgi:hypothetical protein
VTDQPAAILTSRLDGTEVSTARSNTRRLVGFPEVIHFNPDSERVLVVLQAALFRQTWRCVRASSRFQSRSAWIAG